MLVQLNNKQHKLATMMLSVFVGGWLLLLCQSCLASNDNNLLAGSQSVDVAPACHEPDSSSTESNIDISKDHCLGACDCDGISVTLNGDKNSELANKIKFTQNLYVYIESALTISGRAPPVFRIITPPKQATLLPRQTYNVLLI
tara:strand:- start:15758 stop:16189 length:432 start_codon:yes stop_codon:yes gene_type:complete